MLADRLADALYLDAMVIADEARSYFDVTETACLTPVERITFACEAVKVTTRLMHVNSWLATRCVIGETPDARPPALGPAVTSNADSVAVLPPAARDLVAASIDLFRRAELLLERGAAAHDSPVGALTTRLAAAFR